VGTPLSLSNKDSLSLSLSLSLSGAATHSGNGLCNNRPFSSTSEFQVVAAGAATINNIAHTSIQHILSKCVDTSMSLVQNGIYGAGGLMAITNLAAEFRPYYEVKAGTGGQYMLGHDFAVMKLNHLFESVDHIGLTQKLDASLRLWLNCGTVNVTASSTHTYQVLELLQIWLII
jgi:tRNA pseudouridine-54 N-methylase